MDGYVPRLRGLRAEDVEGFIGIAGYSSRSPGIGGVVKLEPEDFQAWEVLDNGLDARRCFEEGVFLDSSGNLVLAVMEKRGIDSIRAASVVAKELGVKPGMVGICGIKDKMSVSWQFISLPQTALKPGRTHEITDSIRIRAVGYIDRQLTSRRLLHNKFRIIIRQARADLEAVEETLRQLAERGVPNFYGHQRFGITRPITPIVGRLILEGRLKEAVSAFLADYSPLEDEKNRSARERLMREWDLASALEYYPRTLRYERRVLRYLVEHEGDYLGALRSLPLRLRRLLVESVSSLIFNKTLSRLLREDPQLSSPEVGDLAAPVGMGGRVEKERVLRVREGNLRQVERLIREGRMTIVLPVPGYASRIPNNRKGEALRKAMEEVGVDRKMFNVRHLPEASTRGDLRPLTIPRWSCRPIRVSDDTVELEMTLPPGSYATILLREIMKPPTPLAFIGKT